MRLLGRLFRTTSLPTAGNVTTSNTIDATLYEGDETLEVVGESYRQDLLWEIVGGWRSDPVRYETLALLVPEPDNAYDSNAISVLITGQLVGYLSREDASAYRPGLLRLIESSENGLVALSATIVGGGERPDGPGRLGVFLDHNPADFGFRPQQASNHGGFRTGLHDAIETDLDDDSYDLSWYTSLPGDDVAAIKQLRKLLKSERDPIDRHYMMGELEKCLYRCRDTFASALDEYDEVCRQHDGEMTTIRSALFEKFGTVPVIETYRQAAIRCQKARDWQAMRHWVERGLVIYGNDAARPEEIEGLHKRLAYANAKIDAATNPKSNRRSATPTSSESEFETLVCGQCGTTFQRPRTTGRKPHSCPACRNV